MDWLAVTYLQLPVAAVQRHWRRMREQFGNAYADSVAKDHVFAKLDSRTVNQALADGVDAKTIWRVVSDEFDVPQHLR